MDLEKPMDKEREAKDLRNRFRGLRKMIEDFERRCLTALKDPSKPLDRIIDIRESYKEIQSRLELITSAQEQGKRNPCPDAPDLSWKKELKELKSAAKECYAKFEVALIQGQEREDLQEDAVSSKAAAVPFRWFRSDENQVIFMNYLERSREAEHKNITRTEGGERRGQGKSRSDDGESLTLFLLKGDAVSLDELQSQIHLRERDILERTSQDELRGILTHFREVDPSEMECILHRFMRSRRFSKLKCILFRVQSTQDLGADALDFIERNLSEMVEGELKSLSI
jgi:hypothetical protein